MELTGLSLPTILKGVGRLTELGLLEVQHQQAADGSSLPNLYLLLEPEAEQAPKASSASPSPLDPWALRPLDAAIAELPAAKNRLAVVARLYAMRFDSDAFPFDFGRMAKLARQISGGATTLCRTIWTLNPQACRGDPLDYITAVAIKNSRQAARRVEAVPELTDDDDPQMRALRDQRTAA